MSLFIPKEDTPVRSLFEVMQELEYTNLYKTCSTLGRSSEVYPVILICVDTNKI